MSTLRVNTLQDATGSNQPAMVGAAKAWVNFNGIGTVAIRAAFNVSSITDNGTGNYTVNFTTAMSDTNYCIVTYNNGNNDTAVSTATRLIYPIGSTTAFPLLNFRISDSTYQDNAFMSVAVFR